MFLSCFLRLDFSSFLFLSVYLSAPSLFYPTQVFMLCSISIFLPLHMFSILFFLFLSCFLCLFTSPFHVTVVSSSLCFCPFIFVRPLLIPAESLLNPLCPSVCTHGTREPLLSTPQSLMCRSYLMSWLMNLNAVTIGHKTDTLRGKQFSLLHGVRTCIALTNLLREKEKRNLISINPPLKYIRFDSRDTLPR